MSIEFKGGKYEVRGAKGELLGTYSTRDDAQIAESLLRKIGDVELSLSESMSKSPEIRGAEAVRKAQGRPPLELADKLRIILKGRKPAEDLATRGASAMRKAQGGKDPEDLAAVKK